MTYWLLPFFIRKPWFSKLQDEEIRRLDSDKEKMKVKVFCDHCLSLNEIELTGENIKAIVGNYFNKGGDIGSLIDIFKRSYE